ncbi:MAG: AcrB/AcrD/AcrF family protein [Hyphomonas sp.]|uniref:Acriflavin resistance protein n=1 Tax=Sphingopyxis fribergensis TaxID=1515612 RepID=A0A0A7PR61_9SPHN|nr:MULTISPECIES: efflux RND transporter permease subunit [Alphaproteobacteria]AJA11748.1 acriflavin resistance protein [Sphingopyxis fribergensis]MBA4228579.1 AcrB/AcrD/AcrF family protein [Hyphomonas sp.]MCW1384632.1 efflux RND transporter permease subunit [Novosphingobium sp. KCTC 2891]PAL19249.1 AcrB/AcrD/AcrF family protein [Sphingopyxis sp. GW247-27LB]
MTEAPLNLAGRLAKTFITSKLTIVFLLASLLLGTLAVALTPREENPQIVVPGAMVTVALPGATAEEVDRLVVAPLEGVLSEMTGVDHSYGVAQPGVGMVQVQFKVGQPPEDSLVKLYNRVIANRGRLPADAGIPLIQAVDADDVPIVTVTLASPTYDDYGLKRLADSVAERLRSTPGVSVVSVYGGRNREIDVAFDPVRLQAFSISLAEARGALAASDVGLNLSGPVEAGKLERLRYAGELGSAAAVRDLVIGVRNGRTIKIGDVATVSDGPRDEIMHLSRFAFAAGDPRAKLGEGEMPAVTIAVAKKKGENAVTVSEAVANRVERMQASFIPRAVHVVTTRDDGQKADEAVDGLMEHLAIALITVSFIMLLFLGWREALIVSVTVPVIFSITLGADLLGGVTINRITLFALILALGLLVDASIVVIENIHRHYHGHSTAAKEDVTVLATNEIGGATNLATFAVMLVFAALLLVTGMAGDYFYPIAYNVPIAMLASIVVAYIVTPWAANRWVKRPAPTGGILDDGSEAESEANTHEERKPDKLRDVYLWLIKPLQERSSARRALMIGAILALLLSAAQGGWQFIRPSGVGGPVPPLGVAMGFLPKDNKNTFNIVITMVEASPVENTARMVHEIDGLLAADPLVTNYQNWIGQAGVPDFNGLMQGSSLRTGENVAEIRVNLVDKQHRSESSIMLVRELRTKVDAIRARYPGAQVRLVEDPPGPPVRATVLAELHGEDLVGLRRLAKQVEAEFAKTYDMVDISNSEPTDVAQWRFVPDREKAALSGVSAADIANVLGLVYDGQVVGRAHIDPERNPVPIRAYVPRAEQPAPSQLEGLYVTGREGRQIPLAELVRRTPTEADKPIQRKDNERVIFIGGELSHSVPVYAVLDLNRRLSRMHAPDGQPLAIGNLSLSEAAPDIINGYQLLWNGEMRMTLDIYRDMLMALGAALTAVYFLLVAYYKSFLIPLIAMSAVPLGIIGIFPGHWLLGTDFSATSIVGIIALSGVVIRNSLLIIDFIQDNQKHGMPLAEAARMAGAVRLRPILLTTLAIVLGSAIMLPDPVFGGLAISLIFGTLASTALTIFVVPLLYERFLRI